MAGLVSSAIQRRIAVFISFMLLLVVILGGRIVWIQFVKGDQLSKKVQNQLSESRILQSPRGTIYDRQGNELGISSLTKSLYADPQHINLSSEVLANLLAPILEVEPAKIKHRLELGGRFIWLQRMMEPEKAAAIQALIKAHHIEGLGFLEENKRYYPNNSLAAQVLGFVGTDDIGLDGIELVMDDLIKGQLAEQAVSTDNRGLPIFQSIFTYSAPKRGKSVYLTLDSHIQFIAEQALDKAMEATKAQTATAIIIDPRSGEILAMVSRPTYNPNEFFRYDAAAWKNRTVSVVYEPGSTFKAIVAAAALEEGLVRANEQFVDHGFIMVSGRRIKNWSGESYGSISFLDIIKNSINTGFVEVAMRLGPARLTNYAKAFGFGQATGVGLAGEEDGILFNPDDMRDSDLATMAIGQSIAVTPLQLVTAIAAIANDGVLVQPYIIKEVKNADGSLYQSASPKSVRQAVSVETARTLTTMLEQVVTDGGGSRAAVKGYRIAGKTGTAEKLREDGTGYYSGRYIASFAGFAPVEQPQVAILVIIDDPDGMYYGGQIAAPVASEILGQVLRYLEVRPQGEQTMQKKPIASNQSAAVVDTSPSVQAPPGKVVIPFLIGKSMRQAGEELSTLGLGMMPVGAGTVVRQSIAANTIVELGTEVTVYFERN